MPSIYQPRRPRASPLWQIVRHGWDGFLADYEKRHRRDLGPLRPGAVHTVEAFLRCGDLASGFTRLQCPDCGHERLLAFTCKTRHFCPACHQRRVRATGEWIADSVCRDVPHRQFVFTMPKVLRGIFRKRRQFLSLLFRTAADTLRDAFRIRLGLPDGKLGAVAAIHTFGDYLLFHPHLHVLAADGLFASDGRFHCMPAGEDLAPAAELFRHRFLQALREAKLIGPRKLAHLLSWQRSGFNIDSGGADPVPARDRAGRKRLAEYLLRHPFSLQKITWNAATRTVIYRSKRHHSTRRNFQVFGASEFIAAALLHLPPKGQQTVRYYGVYSNKSRGLVPGPQASGLLVPPPPPIPAETANPQSAIPNPQSDLISAPPKQSARAMRPLWRDLILKTWGGDPLQCPCCKGTMRPVRQFIRPEHIEFFLRLHGLWEGIVQLPRPPPPPFDIETMERIEPPWRAIREWIPDEDPNLDWFNRPRPQGAPASLAFEALAKQARRCPDDPFDQRSTWRAPEIPLGDGRILVLED